MTPAAVRNHSELVELYKQGLPLEYVFFGSHQQEYPNIVDSSCLSSWFYSPFIVNNVCYPTAEHYLMAQKALLFEDYHAYKRILVAPDPDEARMIGRQVKDFMVQAWENYRFNIVVEGSFAKFTQNPELREFLLGTQDKILAQAIAGDSIWGIGWPEEWPDIDHPRFWNGKNLLGFALMETRSRIRRTAL